MGKKIPNSEIIPVNIVGSSTFGRYNKISSEKTYNMFESDGWLVNTAGWQRVLNLTPAGQGRGIFKSTRGNFLLVVVNALVLRLDPTLAVTNIGTLATSIGEVTIDENLNSQICIVDGVNAYIYNWSLPANLTIQALGGGLIPNFVTYHNTFFLFGNGDRTGNGAAWYAYRFASPTTIVQQTQLALQTKPDFAIAVLRIPGQSANVIVFGTTVCEIHQQIGGVQNYRKINAVGVDYGCVSVTTINASDEYVCWLGINESNSPSIMVFSKEGFARISSDGIDFLLSQIQFPEQSTAMFVRIDGHVLYQLTFTHPNDNLTLMYDFNTKKFFHLSDQNLNYHPARNYAFFNRKIYFVSLNNGSLYEASTTITNINENLPSANPPDPTLIHDMQRIRITANMMLDSSDNFIADRFVFTMEQGYDPGVNGISIDEVLPIISEDFNVPPDFMLITEAGTPIVASQAWLNAPNFVIPYEQRVDLSISIDGGITWSNTVGQTLNPIGLRKNMINWNRLGACNSITIKLRFWGLTRFVVANGQLEIRS